MGFHRLLLLAILPPLLCGTIGFGIGTALGTGLPEYYRSTIRGPVTDPVAVGQGLGLTQGVVVGLIVSLALLALQTWHSRRSADQAILETILESLARLERSVDELSRKVKATDS
jgi:hypothetical protein